MSQPRHKLNTGTREGAEKAAEHLEALTRAYGRALRAAGRRAAKRFRQTEAVTAAVNPDWTPPPVGEILDQQELAADAERKTAKLHRLMLADAARAALEPFGISFDVHAPTSQALLASVGSRIQSGIAAAIEEQITIAIQTGYAEGWSVARVAAEIEKATNEISHPRADMLARTDLNALSNGGSLLAASLSGAAPYKQWLATMDDRTRETHAEADGQVVPIDDPFDVGSEQAQYPGDPVLSDEEACNCRCSIVYVDSLTASIDAPRRAVPRDFASWADHQWEGDPGLNADGGPDVSALAMVAVYPAAVEARALALEGGQDPEGMHVTLVFLGEADSFDHAEAREAVAEVAAAYAKLEGTVGGVGMFAPGDEGAPLIALPDVDGLTALREAVVAALAARGIVSPSGHGFLPHLTLAYVDPNAMLGVPLECAGAPLTFGALSLTIKETRSDYRLGDAVSSPPTSVTSGGTMGDNSDATKPTPASVPAADDGERLALIRAHLAEMGANIWDDDELRAIIVTLEALGLAASGKHRYCGDGAMCEMCDQPRDSASHYSAETVTASLTDFALAAAVDGGTPWQATLCIEGEPTVDSGVKRLLAEGAIEHLPLPLPLAIMDASPHADMITHAPVCGRIDQIWKAGNKWQASGVFADASDEPNLREAGAKAVALVGERMITGISVDLVDVDAEMMVYDAGSVTDLGDLFQEEPSVEANLPGDIPADTAETAIIEEADELDFVMVFTSAKIAGATICPVQALTDATIAVVAGASERAEWRSQSEFVVPLTAAAAGLAPLEPPAAWFADPGFDAPTPLTVTDDGQVYGHLALWGTCHTGRPGACVTPPHSPSGYRHFHRGELKTSEGDRIDVGVLTMNTGHAGLRLNAASTVAHYDDTGTVAAHLRAGEDAHGIWLAGALNPKLPAEDVRLLMAAPPSGDWRELNRGEGLDLFAALAVNVQGFPVPRASARLVAAGADLERVALVAAGRLPEAPLTGGEFERQVAVLAAAADGIEGLAALAAG